MPSPAVSDHLRPTDADCRDGTYRVVGADEDGVALLRVADADGRRVHTGELVRVGRGELAGFEPVANPDGNRTLGAALRSTLVTAGWSIRVFGRQLAARPLPSAAALALVLAGSVGDGVLSLPDAAADALLLAGCLGLAYVGSGRL